MTTTGSTPIVYTEALWAGDPAEVAFLTRGGDGLVVARTPGLAWVLECPVPIQLPRNLRDVPSDLGARYARALGCAVAGYARAAVTRLPRGTDADAALDLRRYLCLHPATLAEVRAAARDPDRILAFRYPGPWGPAPVAERRDFGTDVPESGTDEEPEARAGAIDTWLGQPRERLLNRFARGACAKSVASLLAWVLEDATRLDTVVLGSLVAAQDVRARSFEDALFQAEGSRVIRTGGSAKASAVHVAFSSPWVYAYATLVLTDDRGLDVFGAGAAPVHTARVQVSGPLTWPGPWLTEFGVRPGGGIASLGGLDTLDRVSRVAPVSQVAQSSQTLQSKAGGPTYTGFGGERTAKRDAMSTSDTSEGPDGGEGARCTRDCCALTPAQAFARRSVDVAVKRACRRSGGVL